MAAKTLLALACVLVLAAGCTTPTSDSTAPVAPAGTNDAAAADAGMAMNMTPIAITGTVSSVGTCADPVPSVTPAPQLQDVQAVPMEAWNRTFTGPTSASPGATGFCVAWLGDDGAILREGGSTVPPGTADVLVRATAAVQATYTITIA